MQMDGRTEETKLQALDNYTKDDLWEEIDIICEQGYEVLKTER